MEDKTRNEDGTLDHPSEGFAREATLEALDAAEAKRRRILELLDEPERQDPADAMGDRQQQQAIRQRNREREEAAMTELIDCATGAVLDLGRAITYALLN